MYASKTTSGSGRAGRKGRPPLPRGRDSWGHALRLAQEERDWEDILHHLPDNVRQLWDALRDTRQLWRVLQAYGGHNVRVPRQEPDAKNPLRRRLGLRCVRKLMAAFGGTFVYVPRCTALREKLRQREIIEAFGRHTAHGLSSTAAVAARGMGGADMERVAAGIAAMVEDPEGSRATGASGRYSKKRLQPRPRPVCSAA